MVESIESIRRSAQNWAGIGKFLGSTMRPDDLIAVGPAGAVPYFSNLPTIDMLGLCDSWVAEHGRSASNAAGHEKVATPEYLKQRGVVWIVGQPHVARVPDRDPEKISIKLPVDAYLILGTTLDSDSLRRELEGRGREVAWPDTAAQAAAGREAARSLIRGWHLLAKGRTSEAQKEAQDVLRVARTLGVTWQWLLREGGLLELECLKEDRQKHGERKRWDQVEGRVPRQWKAALEAAQAAARGVRHKGGDRTPRQD
jgi:hypothetical protein